MKRLIVAALVALVALTGCNVVQRDYDDLKRALALVGEALRDEL